MLQKIGDSLKGGKIVAWLILIPLVVVFTIWGATGAVSLDFFGPQTYAAKVNGERIELQEANDAWQNEQARWAQQFATDIPEDQRQTLQDGVLERLIVNRLITIRGVEAGYRVGGDRVQEAIRNEAAFQVDGKYSETLALARLAQVGVTVDQYREDLRKGLQNEELQRALGIGEFVTPVEVGRRFALEDEQRELRYSRIALAPLLARTKLDEQAINEWYTANAKRFETPESVKLQYAEATLAEVAATLTPTEAELQGLYADNKDRYQDTERRRARHILVETEAQAKEILTSLQGGADFAVLARERSKDTGSAQMGGDLGLSDRNAFVKPFADALFAMKEGELRGPVKTEFGYHVIRLDAIQAARSKSFEEVRAELADQWRNNQAADLFGDKLDRIQTRLEAGKVEFDALVTEEKLKIGDIDAFTRTAGAPALGAEPSLVEAVFADAAVNQRKIGGPIALGDDRFVVFRVLEHRKPTVPPLASVRAQVVEQATREAAARTLRATADEIVAAVKGGESFEKALAARGLKAEPAKFIDRRDPATDAALRETAFGLPRPREGVVAVGSAAAGSGDAYVVQVTSVKAAGPVAEEIVRRLRAQQLITRQGQSALAAYVEELRRTADVKRNPQAFQ
jgi:peptidyl-prolyl cis-trans isomerase D